MVAEIIAIGTEILLGDIVNTNTTYLARQLATLGISVYYQTVVGDNPQRLEETLRNSFERSDIVITTGGLGPTQDDLSKEVGAKIFDKELIIDERAMKWINDYFIKRNKTVSENNKKQALIPKDAIPLYNDNGTAPGVLLTHKDKTLVMLPGPPNEMIPMFENNVIPYLRKLTDEILVSRVLRICGIGEGHMEEQINDIINAQTNPTIAPYAKEGEVILRITAKAKTEEEANDLINPVAAKIYKRLGISVYGEGEEALEHVVAKMLLKNQLSISIAESCTGGLVSAKLINYPGISDVFKEGIITYSNESKNKHLNVSEDTLRIHGAVSEETAKEMCIGIASNAGTDVAISVTGIAGPSGGTEEKPVGLVYIGVYIKGEASVKRIICAGNRQKIRTASTICALDFLRRELIRKEYDLTKNI